MLTRVNRNISAFVPSVIQVMSRLALANNAVNLALGLPDFACPPELKRAVKEAVDADENQYSIASGDERLRQAIAEKTARTYPGWKLDPETEICVTCGATEATIAAMMALLERDDEVIIFEPYYENYGPDAILAHGKPVFVPLRRPDWAVDEEALRAAFSNRTRAIVVNTPHNPTGKVFTRSELELIAELCQRYDALCITDEIYEHVQYLGEGGHIPPATIPGLRDRTITINSLSKTYAVTGWRVGWASGPSWAIDAIRVMHDLLSVGAPTPLQLAGVTALRMPDAYYTQMVDHYSKLRDLLCSALIRIGFDLHVPDGAYYVLCDTSKFDPARDDVAFARRLILEFGVGAVPGSSFYSNPADGRDLVRFAFPKKAETLAAAVDRLERLNARS